MNENGEYRKWTDRSQKMLSDTERVDYNSIERMSFDERGQSETVRSDQREFLAEILITKSVRLERLR
jgi:hypothetical protein